METEVLVEHISTEESNGKILYVLQCQILKGSIKVGLNMSLPFSAGIDMTIPVDEVEIIDQQRIKIKVQCEDIDELDFLNGLNLKGEILNSEK